MYSLEERIYFDGAAAAAVTLADNNNNSTSTSENSDASSSADISNTDNSSTSANSTVSDAGTAKDTSSAPAKDTNSSTTADINSAASSADSFATSGKVDIDALIASILNTDTASSDTTHTTLVVSTAVENADALATEAQEHNITVVTYDPAKETLQQLFKDIQTALNGEKASSINFVTTDNSAAGFSLISASTISAENISINSDVSTFVKETASLLTDGGRLTISGDASLTDSSFSALETAFADAAGVKVSFIDASNGDVTTAAPDAMDYNIIFVDASVPGYEDLLKNLSPDTEVYFLNKDSDGVSQISNYLDGKLNVDSIQIIAHGNDGEIMLGKTRLFSETIAEHATEIQNWGKSLTADGDILIYSCDTAKTDAGKDFTNEIARLTGADLAVSTDGTGGPDGNWTLEYTTGSIEAAEAFDGRDYQYHLGVSYVSNTSDDVYTRNSLRWAVADASTDGDIVEFWFDDDHTSYAINLGSSDLFINYSITINGIDSSSVTISSTNASIVISNNVTIQNLTFSGMHSTIDGGAIYINAGNTVTLENLSFMNCTSSRNGGAILIATSSTATSVTITDSTFTNCYTTGTIANTGSGGAICVVKTVGDTSTTFNTTLTLNNCTFGNASSTSLGNHGSGTGSAGGAIYLQGVTLNLNNSSFYYNHTEYLGGAIYAHNDATININDGCAFTGNYVTTSFGGAICSNSSINFSGSSTFTNNSAVSGGAIGATTITCTNVTSLVFSGNTASCYGGAIYDADTASLYNTSFTSNSAAYGGAIYVDASASLQLGTSSFYGNTATIGTAIYSEGLVRIDNDPTISETSATAATLYLDTSATLSMEAGTSVFKKFNIVCLGDINIIAGTLTLGAGSFLTDAGGTITGTSNSSLSLSGGTAGAAISMTLPTISGSLKNLTVGSYTSVKISNNLTIATDGTLTLGRSSNLFLNGYILSLTSSTTGNATAIGSSTGVSTIYGGADPETGGPGILAINDGNATHRATISNITFTKTTYTSVVLGSGDFASFDNCNFTDNAKTTGVYTFGAIRNDSGGDVTIANCTFSGNTSSVGASKGGAISNYGTMVISNTSFSNNTSNLSGGAIWNVGTLTVSSCTFSGNTAVSNGGAIYSYSGTLNLSGNTTFQNNTAGTSGGAIYNNETLNSSANLTDTSASRAEIYNTATGLLSLTGNATFTHFSITNAAAGTFTIGAYTLTLDNSTVTGALTGGSTSSLRLAGGTSGTPISMTLPTITGGLLNLSINDYTSVKLSEALTIAGSGSLTLGTSSNLFLNGYNLTLTGSTTATATTAIGTSSASSIIYGGVDNLTPGEGIIVVNGASAAVRTSLSKLTFTNSLYSPVVISSESYGNITNCTFTDNTSTSNGGAICVNSFGNLTISSSIFTDNASTSNGGAIYNNGTLTLAGGNIDFSGNTATNGNAIYNNGTLYATNSVNVRDISDVPDQQIYNAAGMAITLTGSATFTNFNIVNNGTSTVDVNTLTLDNTSVTLNQITTTSSSTLSLRNTSYTLLADMSLKTLNLNNATLTLGSYDLTIATSISGNVTATSIIEGSATGGSGQILIETGKTVIIGCVTIRNGYGSSILSIDSGETVSIVSSIFSNNQNNAGIGGAIYNAGTLNLSGGSVEFNSNTATTGNAIYNNNVMTLSGRVSVIDTTASSQVIYIAPGTSLNLTGDATIAGINVVNDSGALNINAYMLTVRNVTVTGTLTGSSTSKLNIADSTSFKLPNAITLAELGLGVNSNLYLCGYTLTLEHSARGAISANIVSTIYGGASAGIADGGLIKIASGSESTPITIGWLKIAECNNSATHVYAGAYLSVTHCIYTDNNKTVSGTSYGGAIYVAENASGVGGTLTVDQTSFLSNSVTASSNNQGGAIWIGINAAATISNCTFDNNSATNGGAIYNATTIKINGYNVFTKNSATENGGALYMATGSVATIGPISMGSLTNATFGNTANLGGAIYNAGTMTFTGSGTVGFYSNTATTGNAIYNVNAMNISGNADLCDSTASSQIVYIASGASLNLTGNARIADITVINDNGTFNINEYKLTVDNATVTGTLTGSSTSSLEVDYSSTFNLPNSLELSTLVIHGTLNLGTYNLTINNTIMGSATATISGTGASGSGKIQIAAGKTVTISEVTIENGYDTILSIDSGETVSITGTTFSENSGTNGGAISTAGTLNLTNCSFENNTATGNGGAIYSSAGTVKISSTGLMSGNTASNGSFIYIGNSSALTISSCSIASTDTENIYVNGNGMTVNGVNTLSAFTIGLYTTLSFNSSGAASLFLPGSSFTNDSTGTLNGDANDLLSFTYTGADSVLTGNIGTLTLNCAGGAVNMPGNLTVYTSLALSNGSLSIGANTLSLGGTVTGNITGGNTSSIAFIGTGNTTVLPTITGGLKDLIMNGAGGKMTLGADLTIANSLTLNAGYLDIANYDLTLGTDATLDGTPSSSSFVMTSGTGDFIKYFDATHTEFTFALGNYSSGSWYYTPISVSFTGLETVFGVNSYVSAHLYNVMEPNVTENAYITRYWTLNSANITDFEAEISATYVANDVVTSEAVLNGMLYIEPTDPPPLIPEVSGWQTLSAVNTGTHTFTGTGITKFGNFTAYGHYTPPVSTSTTNPVPAQNNDQQRQADQWLMDSDNSTSLFAETQLQMPTITISEMAFSSSSWNTISSSLISTANGLSNGESGVMIVSSVEMNTRNPIIIDEQEELYLTGTDGAPSLTDNCDYTPMSLWSSRYEKHPLFQTNVDKLLDALITA